MGGNDMAGSLVCDVRDPSLGPRSHARAQPRAGPTHRAPTVAPHCALWVSRIESGSPRSVGRPNPVATHEKESVMSQQLSHRTRDPDPQPRRTAPCCPWSSSPPSPCRRRTPSTATRRASVTLLHRDHAGRVGLLRRRVRLRSACPHGSRDAPSWCCWPTSASSLAVAVFWYPTTFVPRQQTVFGWFENDVYTGLLMIAWTLGALRLGGLTLAPVVRRGSTSTGTPRPRVWPTGELASTLAVAAPSRSTSRSSTGACSA